MAGVFYFPIIGTPVAEGNLLSFSFNGSTQAFQFRPSTLQTPLNRAWFKAETPFPFGCAPRNSIERQHSIPRTILGLYRSCGPDAIRGIVATIVVNPFQRMIRRTWTHIRQELPKIVQPQWRHRDASAAVALSFFNPGVIASGFSRSPGSIFARLAHTMRTTAPTRRFAQQTATTPNCVLSQLITQDSRLLSAFALTQPTRTRALPFSRSFRDDCQSTTDGTNHIDQAWLHLPYCNAKTIRLEP